MNRPNSLPKYSSTFAEKETKFYGEKQYTQYDITRKPAGLENAF